jgi:purine-nucleoside phosphorylase
MPASTQSNRRENAAAAAAVLTAGSEIVRRQWNEQPKLGLILGTGLHKLVNGIDVEVAIDYSDIPGFPRSTALSHRGRYLCGRLDGMPLMVMDGRCHFYEGYSAEALMLPVQVMAAMGIEALVVSNAAGGVNPNPIQSCQPDVDDSRDRE